MDHPQIIRTERTGYPDKQPVRNPAFAHDEAKHRPSRFDWLNEGERKVRG